MIQSPTFSIGVQSSTLETYPDSLRPFIALFALGRASAAPFAVQATGTCEKAQLVEAGTLQPPTI